MKTSNKRELQQIKSNNLSSIDFKDFMKLYKNNTEEIMNTTIFILVYHLTFSSDNALGFRTNLLLMSISDKIKTINNKIEQRKAQYNLDKQTATISALSSRNVSKYEFLTSKDVLTEIYLLEKAATMKRFKYSPLGKELKKQTSVAEKQY